MNRSDYKALRLIVIFAAITLLVMCIHPFLTAWTGSLTGHYALTKTWKELLIFFLLLSTIAIFARQKKVLKIVCSDRLNQIIFLFALLHIMLTLIFYKPNESEAIVAGILFNLRFLGIFLLLRLVHFLIPQDKNVIVEKITKIFLLSAIGVAVFGILQVTVLPPDFLTHFGYNGVTTINPYSTVDDNPDVLRAFSTQRGPNTLGSFLLLPLALFLTNIFARKNQKISYIGAGLIVITILLTYSRSAVLATLIVIVLVALIMERRRVKKLLPILAISGGIVAITVGALILTIPAMRLYVFHSSPGDSSLVEGSTSDHFQATVDNTNDALSQPLGQGPGSAGPASFYLRHSQPKIAENYFVQIAQEVGLIGLGLFILLSILIGKRLLHLIQITPGSYLAVGLFASFIGINVINLFLHGWADDPTSIVWWGLAGLVIPYAQTSASASRTKAVS